MFREILFNWSFEESELNNDVLVAEYVSIWVIHLPKIHIVLNYFNDFHKQQWI